MEHVMRGVHGGFALALTWLGSLLLASQAASLASVLAHPQPHPHHMVRFHRAAPSPTTLGNRSRRSSHLPSIARKQQQKTLSMSLLYLELLKKVIPKKTSAGYMDLMI